MTVHPSQTAQEQLPVSATKQIADKDGLTLYHNRYQGGILCKAVDCRDESRRQSWNLVFQQSRTLTSHLLPKFTAGLSVTGGILGRSD